MLGLVFYLGERNGNVSDFFEIRVKYDQEMHEIAVKYDQRLKYDQKVNEVRVKYDQASLHYLYLFILFLTVCGRGNDCSISFMRL